MPEITRLDRAVIHYEVFGAGYPLLLIAPGGVNSEVAFWWRSAINPVHAFAAEFQVIAMDQRHAGKSTQAPPAFAYADAVGDQLAVLDAVGARRAHVWGGCIGVAYALRLAHDAPERVSAIVGQDPVGLDATNSRRTFTAMFAPTLELARAQGMRAVVDAALSNPIFMVNNAGGPFARRSYDDAAFRDHLLGMDPAEYVRLVQAFEAGIWPDNPPLFTVPEAWLPECHTPLLILPGSDAFHPTSIAQMICQRAPRARCLDVDCRSAAKIGGTIEAIGAFLREHAPA